MIEALSHRDIALEYYCNCWDGDRATKPKPDCWSCDGKGYHATPFGNSIITMLRHQGLIPPAPAEEEEE